MGQVLNSIDNIITSSQLLGNLPILFMDRSGATTAALTTCGYVTVQRLSRTITLPSSFGNGVTGVVFPRIDMFSEDGANVLVAGLEYELGTLTVSGNSFSDGVAMPTKEIFNKNIQTATQMAFVYVSTALTATNPVLTITYTDQDGNTGQTATMTLPTSPLLGSTFFITPHLANGDTGIRDITNISISTGSAGVLKVYGLLVLQQHLIANSNVLTRHHPYMVENLPWKGSASDKISFYRFGSAGAFQFMSVVCCVGDY